MKLTQQRLRELLDYDPDTGVFTWLVDCGPGRPNAGDRAGCLNIANGYVHIHVDNTLYIASRLAWLWMTGKWPSETVDHWDLCKSNNRWGNLREATRSQNAANRRPVGKYPKGVSYHAKSNDFIARVGGKNRIYLGHFKTPEAAHAAYCEAAKEMHGEFARTA